MQDLRLLGVHEDGEHLLLADGAGNRFRLAVDEPLRTAVRRDPPHLSSLQAERDSSLRPRDVQALIRAGVSAEAVAQRAGWSVEKVRRFEGPILAEREHVAGLAKNARLRARSGAPGSAGGSGSSGSSWGGTGAPVLSTRVAERMAARGVDSELVTWDSWRAEEGPWTVVLTFAAGGRQRQASWHFDTVDRVVAAVDDEARWLSEDERSGTDLLGAGSAGNSVADGSAASTGAASASRAPGPASSALPAREARVYDVEAEGGVQSEPAQGAGGSRPVDLMTAMRQRTGARGRRSTGGSRSGPHATMPDATKPDAAVRPDVLPDDQDTQLPLEVVTTDASGDAPTDGPPVVVEPDAFEPAAVAHVDAAEVDAAEVDAEEVDFEHLALDADHDREALDPAGAAASSDDVPAPVGPPAQGPRPTPAPRKGRRGGRPSVPSWDDIVFGTKQGPES